MPKPPIELAIVPAHFQKGCRVYSPLFEQEGVVSRAPRHDDQGRVLLDILFDGDTIPVVQRPLELRVVNLV
jgi:hypothetical protein